MSYSSSLCLAGGGLGVVCSVLVERTGLSLDVDDDRAVSLPSSESVLRRGQSQPSHQVPSSLSISPISDIVMRSASFGPPPCMTSLRTKFFNGGNKTEESSDAKAAFACSQRE